MAIPTESYDALHARYSAALEWMSELGIKLGPNRTAHYERVLGHWRVAFKSASDDEARDVFPDFVSSLFEIYDFVDIHAAFKRVPRERLSKITDKLRKAVNGPLNAVEETPKSTSARNALFEAVVAARAHRPESGVEAILDAESDTGIAIDGKSLWVECKRVTTIPRLQDNARKASQQLEQVLNREVGANHRGIVAIDVTKILNAGDRIYVAHDDSQLLTSVDRMMDEFITKHSEVWQRIYQRRHRKIIGTIVRVAFMATSEARNLLVHSSQWAMNPRLGAPEGDVKVQQRLAHRLRKEF